MLGSGLFHTNDLFPSFPPPALQLLFANDYLTYKELRWGREAGVELIRESRCWQAARGLQMSSSDLTLPGPPVLNSKLQGVTQRVTEN